MTNSSQVYFRAVAMPRYWLIFWHGDWAYEVINDDGSISAMSFTELTAHLEQRRYYSRRDRQEADSRACSAFRNGDHDSWAVYPDGAMISSEDLIAQGVLRA